jgi:signal transduction histidine kinase
LTAPHESTKISPFDELSGRLTKRIHPLLIVLVGLVGGATALVAALPSLSFAYRGEVAHVVIETAGTLVVLLAAFILLGRVRQAPSRSELLLFVGLLVLFAASLARSVSPSFTGENEAVVWVPLSANLIAASVLAAAAFASDAEVRRAQAFRITGGVVVGAALLMLAVAFLSDRLPTGIDPGVSPNGAASTLVVGSPGVLVTQLASMALFAIGAVGFGRRARRSGDEFLAWLAIALALFAIARLNYFLFPSLYSEWVFTGDFLRFAGYLTILVGALRQIAAYQRAAARAAVLEDRSRIARDLHDSLAQDLAFISMQGDRIAVKDERGAELAQVARLALAASRGAIEHLRRSDDPLGPALARACRALADRYQVDLTLDVDDGVQTTPEARDDLLLIAGEAISNAVRHGEAEAIRVRLAPEAGNGVRLAIADDGGGFDPGSAPSEGSGGFGLAGIRERAERLGGHCRIRSRRGEGASVEVVIP